MKTVLLLCFSLFSILFTSTIFSQTIQWEQLSGPHGGAIYSIVKDNNGNIYANTMWGAGPFKSTDNGESWFSIKNGLTPYSGEFHPLNINSSGDLFISGAHSTALICRSTNQGISWIPLNNLNTNGGSVICISFDNSDNVFVGTGTGIYKSTNNGEDWATLPQFGPVQVDAIAFNDSGYIFAGTSYGVYRSTDDGVNWTQLPTGGGTRTVAVAPNGNIFAGCWENAGILRSTDNGDSWTYVYPQTVSIRSASTILFDENDYTYMPTYGNGILFSTDFGDSWTELNDGLGYKYVRAITKNNNRYLFTAGDYGIYKMVYFAFWYSVGLPICSVKELLIDPYNNIFAGVWGVNRSYDEGLSWQTINNGLSGFDVRALTIKEDGTIFLGSGISNWAYPNPCIFRSTDNGNSWVEIENEIQRHDVEAITVDAVGNVYAGNYYGVYKSTNNGDNWVNIGGVGGAKGLEFNSQGDLFLASWGGGVWRLPQGDTVWVNITGSIYPYVDCIYIGSNDYVYAAKNRSIDNGATWTSLNIPVNNVFSYNENSVGDLFCGTYNYGGGVFRSTDYGETWEAINTGLPTQDVRCVAVDADDYLYAGPWGYSLFKTTTSTVTSVDNEKQIPSSFSLEQNYPNPFNPSTKISWQSPVNSLQTIKVFDVLGKEVETIVDGYYEAGLHSTLYIVNSTLPNGVYFYQLRAGDFVETKKMLLLK